MASLKPTFLWRRIKTRRPARPFTRACAGMLAMTGVKCQRDRTTYATIFVKPATLIASRGNASTPTEPTKRCIVTFRLSVRNGKYKGQRLNCQAQAPQSGGDGSESRDITCLLTGIQNAALSKCQTPHPIPANANRSRISAANTISLNFK